MRGEGGDAKSQPISTAAHRAQINLGDLTPYLTYNYYILFTFQLENWLGDVGHVVLFTYWCHTRTTEFREQLSSQCSPSLNILIMNEPANTLLETIEEWIKSRIWTLSHVFFRAPGAVISHFWHKLKFDLTVSQWRNNVNVGEGGIGGVED